MPEIRGQKAWLLAGLGWMAAGYVASVAAPDPIDPAAWGGDHVGKPMPDYITGEECLFCHRDVGATWGGNRHQLTMRPVDDRAGMPEGAQFLMGNKRATRVQKRSKSDGKLDMHTVGGSPHWDTKIFSDRCAGCHATAVDSEARAFAALSLDCFVCHGNVSLEHTKDTSRVLLSKTNRESHHIASTCGQCHLRGGRSKSTELPYPNHFVSGDNLFRDFQVDLSKEAVAALPAVEQHIYSNTRDVVMLGQTATTCLSCHDVHGGRTKKHQKLTTAVICSSCHVSGTDNEELKEALLPANRLRDHSRVCDY